MLLIVGLGAALMRRADFASASAPFGAGPGRSRRAAAIVVITGVIAAVFVGAGQLGADVGGVITLGAGIAAMAVLMLPGTPSRRMIALALAAPFLAVAGLALLDLATGGNGHFTRTILHADSARALWDVVKRRYTLAFNVLEDWGDAVHHGALRARRGLRRALPRAHLRAAARVAGLARRARRRARGVGRRRAVQRLGADPASCSGCSCSRA